MNGLMEGLVEEIINAERNRIAGAVYALDDRPTEISIVQSNLGSVNENLKWEDLIFRAQSNLKTMLRAECNELREFVDYDQPFNVKGKAEVELYHRERFSALKALELTGVMLGVTISRRKVKRPPIIWYRAWEYSEQRGTVLWYFRMTDLDVMTDRLTVLLTAHNPDSRKRLLDEMEDMTSPAHEAVEAQS